MDAELAAAVAAFADGVSMNVSGRCRDMGVSTTTFYKYVDRFTRRGVEGLFPDSRKPLSSPGRLPVELEDVLVRVRKEEADGGWDYGADAVLLRLKEHPQRWPQGQSLPSRSTINRVFEARGLLAKLPQRRPRKRHRRFQREQANELWQFDGFEYHLASGTTAVVLHLNDDCSRVDLALEAVSSENGQDVWDTFCLAVARYGLPVAVLNDNGTAFSGRRRGWTSAFEQRLTDLRVQPICSSVQHPQTCGKNERAHQRVLKWLQKQPIAGDLEELQGLLDRYRAEFNARGSQVHQGLTPNQRFDLAPLARPDGVLESITHVTRHRVSNTGSIGLNSFLIGIGRREAKKAATVFRNGDHLTVFIEDQLARELVLDHNRRYQRQDR